MFSPTRIEVHNLGSIQHAVVEPDQSGITTFDGATGSGKSTVLNAIAWVCYGHIGGIDSFTEQAELRSDFCPHDEPAGAVVEFDWHGSHIKASRHLNRSRTGRESAAAALWIDGQQQIPMSPDRLTDKIVEITGMSGRAFTSAFFIAQHQLERLAMGRPSDIKAVIEDQTGLGALSTKVKDASADAKKLLAAADALPGSRDDVDEARTSLDTAQTAGADAWEAFETARTAADNAGATARQTRATLTALQQQDRDAHQAAIDAAEARARLDAAERRVTELRNEAANFTTPNNNAEQPTDLATLTDALTAADQARHDLTAARTSLDTTMARGRTVKATLDAADPDLDSRHRQLTDTIADLDGQLAALRHRHTQLSASLRIVTDADDQTRTCPTCQQHIADVTTVADAITAELNQVADTGRATKTELQQATAQRPALQQQLDDRDRAAAEWEALTAAKHDADQRLTTATTAADTAHTTLCQTMGIPTGTTADDAIAAGQTRRDELTRAHWEAEQQRRVHTQLEAAEQHLHTCRQNHQQSAATNEQHGADPQELAAAQTADQAAQAAYEAADQTRQELQVEANLLRGRAEEAERAHQRAKDTLAVKVTAWKEADTARDAHAVLVEQRRELLASYTRTISESATEVMEQIGGGRHVGVELGEDFIPRVVLPDGRTRPFRNCSGGEKMRAALCLCLGQAAQQSGSHLTGMLFADEIATGYDPETTTAVIEALTTLGRPIVLIGHNEQIRSVAAKTYRFDHNGHQSTVTGADTIAPAA